MKTGIFSGSFNPVHIGHLILANYIAEYTDIDEVWFVVTPHNPLKEEVSLLSEQERLNMVKLATKPYSKLRASDFEFSLPRPSYTVDTLHALTETYPRHEFYLIIGGDNWESFAKWKDYRNIIENYKILIYPRLNTEITIEPELKDKVGIIDSPVIEISSTFIRQGLEEGRNVRPFLPVEVFDYITENKLYCSKNE